MIQKVKNHDHNMDADVDTNEQNVSSNNNKHISVIRMVQPIEMIHNDKT